jgi:iron(III) transport system substrate-binding protein
MVDAARLWRAQIDGFFRPIQSKYLESRIPANLRSQLEPEGSAWFGFSTRARLVVYSKAKINPILETMAWASGLVELNSLSQ